MSDPVKGLDWLITSQMRVANNPGIRILMGKLIVHKIYEVL